MHCHTQNPKCLIQPNLRVVNDEIQDVTNCVQCINCDWVTKDLHKIAKVKS